MEITNNMRKSCVVEIDDYGTAQNNRFISNNYNALNNITATTFSV